MLTQVPYSDCISTYLKYIIIVYIKWKYVSFMCSNNEDITWFERICYLASKVSKKCLQFLMGDELFSTLQPLFHSRDMASLSILSLFSRKVIRRTTILRSTRPKSFGKNPSCHSHCNKQPTPHRIRSLKSKFHLVSFPRKTALWNWIQRGCFPDH